MQTIAVTGATGFIGRHLLTKLGQRTGIRVRALTRQHSEQGFSRPEDRLSWICGDLADSSSVTNLLTPHCTLINLAFPESWPPYEHIESTRRLADAAARYGVRRVIHCSTAVVVGNTRSRVVTEATEPVPQTEYEKSKLAIERIWQSSAAGRFDLVICRPSAVFGPGGKNLAALADALTHGTRFLNCARSILYGKRKMNLVHVQKVVAAIELLMDQRESFDGDTFNISSDDDPLNNFRDVERILMREFGISDYPLPPLSAPKFVLSSLLWLAGRSNTDPDRVYDSTKLEQLGLHDNQGIEQGLCDFAAWYLPQRRIA